MIDHKITPGTPDEICQQCAQLYGAIISGRGDVIIAGDCRAFSMPHSDEERDSRATGFGMECDDYALKELRWRKFNSMYHTPPGKWDMPNPNLPAKCSVNDRDKCK